MWLLGEKGVGGGARKWVALTEKEVPRWLKWDKTRSLERWNKCGW